MPEIKGKEQDESALLIHWIAEGFSAELSGQLFRRNVQHLLHAPRNGEEYKDPALLLHVIFDDNFFKSQVSVVLAIP